MTSAHLKRNIPFAQNPSSHLAQQMQGYFRGCTEEFLQYLSEITLNLLKGNIPFFLHQYKKLKNHKKLIRLLADRKISLKRKCGALQKTGVFLLSLLTAAIPIVGELIGGLVRKHS